MLLELLQIIKQAATSTLLLQVEEVATTAATEPIAQETVADGQRILAAISKENCK
jgi:hypothetical protein